MEMCALGDILQDKSDKILGNIRNIKKFIHNLLVFRMENFSKHIYQIRVIFARMHARGLKFNAPKLRFGLN